MIRAGQFRADLYFRLRQLVIPTPALTADRSNFCEIVQKAWQRTTGDAHRQLPEALVAELRARRWAGNVRELKSVLVSLQALFGSDGLRTEHLRALLRFYEQVLAPDQSSGAAEDAARYRVECLGHLRRAEEVVHACKVALRPVEEGASVDAAARESLRLSLGCLREDIDQLCREPALFHGKDAYECLDTIGRRLSYFLRRLDTGDQELARWWRMELAPEVERAVLVVFQEIQQVMAQV